MPTENDPPASPTNNPITRNCQNSVAYDIIQMGTTVHSINRKNTIRPPKRSVHSPRGTRISDPDSTGIAASRPNSVSLRFSCFLIGIPITANIIHTAKQIVNATVLEVSTMTGLRSFGSMRDNSSYTLVSVRERLRPGFAGAHSPDAQCRQGNGPRWIYSFWGRRDQPPRRTSNHAPRFVARISRRVATFGVNNLAHDCANGVVMPVTWQNSASNHAHARRFGKAGTATYS